MSQLKKIDKAIALIRPLAVSVAARRPAGMSSIAADSTARDLQAAVEALHRAATNYRHCVQRDS